MNWNIFSILTERAAKRRNQELAEWAATIPVTDAQQGAMMKLWKASQSHKPPSEDPLLSLCDSDREYLRKICSADFRPARFGDIHALHMVTHINLTKRGFSPEQAVIIVGMTFNGVGMKDIEGAM